MREDLALPDDQHDVAQLAVLAQHVDRLEGVPRVFVGGVREARRGGRALQRRVHRAHHRVPAVYVS